MSDPHTELPPLLSVDPHVMDLLDVSRGTAYRMVREGDVPSVRVGKRLLKVPRDKFLQQLGLLEGSAA